MHNRCVQSQTIDLIERVSRRLREVEKRCLIAGPTSEAAVAAAEETLGYPFPPSYREFLLRYGTLTLPSDLAVVHDFIGISPPRDGSALDGVVEHTIAARQKNGLGDNLMVVGLGAQASEWFCLDATRPDDGGELPVLLFDARDNHVDQIFYEDFGAMLHEVLEFVEDSLNPDQGSRA